MELSIDTASELASIALSEQGSLLAELSWRCRANHSVEVLPAIDGLLESARRERASIEAIFVCRGPGSYGGLRAGLSLAMALASALGVPALGLGRLELDAYPHLAYPGPVCAVHRAGRGELAWSAYRAEGDRIVELVEPQIAWPADLAERVPEASLFCGEIDQELADLLRSSGRVAGIAGPGASIRRAGFMAELGWRRFAAGARSPGGFVEPLYLREPNITKPKPRI